VGLAVLMLGYGIGSDPVPPVVAAEKPSARQLTADDSAFVRKVIDENLCPCGCGNYLPGSSQTRACFGCAVGTAEVARMIDGLKAGRSHAQILLSIRSGIIIDVFADYTDRGLATTWEQVQRVARAYEIDRVVLRTPGRTRSARSAVKLVECARRQGLYTAMQLALINHTASWDTETLLAVASRLGVDVEQARACLAEVDVDPQIMKDREHASNRGLHRYPAVTINRVPVAAREDALRQAVLDLLEDSSF
jgi:hypothetical protein